MAVEAREDYDAWLLKMLAARDVRAQQYCKPFNCELCRQGRHRECVRPCYCAAARHEEVAT